MRLRAFLIMVIVIAIGYTLLQKYLLNMVMM
jgi:hypothetical protein